MNDDAKDEFAKALGADVVIPLGNPGALSLTEALTLRDWFDERRRNMEAIRPDQGHVC